MSTLIQKNRLYLVCKASQHVEDENHFMFDCLLYSHIRAKHASVFQQTSSVSDFFASLGCDVVASLRAVFPIGAVF